MRALTRRGVLPVIATGMGMLADPSRIGAQGNPKIVVATGLDPAFADYVVAVKKGFLKNYGVESELRSYDDGNVALDALLTGIADVGSTSEFGPLTRWSRGGQIFIMASNVQSTLNCGIVAKKSITKPADLIGKKIGTTKGSSSHFFLAQYIQFHKIDLKSLNITFIRGPESVAALSRGDIDALFINEPWITRTVAAIPDSHVVARMNENNVMTLHDYVIFSKRLIDNPDLSLRVFRGLMDAAAWIPGNLEETTELVSATYRLTSDQTKAMLGIFTYNYEFNYAEYKRIFDRAGEFAKSIGIIDMIPDVNFFLKPELLRSIAPERVKMT